MSSWLLQSARDFVLAVGSVAVAEVSTNSTKPVADALVEWSPDLAIYVGLAIFASFARGFFDARDGKMPDRALLRRAAVVATFVGLVGGALVAELAWSPGIKMATISMASFGLDWSIPAFQKAGRAWITRLVSPPDPSDPPKGGGGA